MEPRPITNQDSTCLWSYSKLALASSVGGGITHQVGRIEGGQGKMVKVGADGGIALLIHVLP